MKKIFTTIIYLSIIILPSEIFANFFIEPSFIYIRDWSDGGKGMEASTGSANNFGGILSLGGNIHRDVNLIGRAGYIVGKGEYDLKNSNMTVKGDLSIFVCSMGAEYVPFFPVLFENRMKWKISLYTGFAHSESKGEDGGPTKDDMGISFSFSTGLEFMVTQRISPYFEIGYQKVFFIDEFKDYDYNQLVFLFGFRIHVSISKGLDYYY